jgi:hypothetical protein
MKRKQTVARMAEMMMVPMESAEKNFEVRIQIFEGKIPVLRLEFDF